MSGYLIASIPWLAGGLIYLARLAGPQDPQHYERGQLERNALPPEFLFGLGGIVGYVVWSNGLWAVDQFNHTLLNLGSVAGLLILVVAAAFRVNKTKAKLPVFRSLTAFNWLLVAIVSSLLGVALYLHHANPLFAWDALNHWAANAREFISQNLTDELGVFNYQYRKHPTTVVMISAWAGWSMQFTGTSGWGTPWLLCSASVCLMTAGFIRALTRNSTLALLGVAVAATVPLAESHTLVAGYAELWLSAVVLAGLFLFGLGMQYQRKSWIFEGVLIGGLAMIMKNTGLGYTICVWCALVSSWLIYRPRLSAVVLPALGVTAYLMWDQGFSFKLGANVVEWNPPAQQVYFAGRVMFVELHPMEQIVKNLLHSLLVNQSFSTAAIALFFVVSTLTYARTSPLHGLSRLKTADITKSPIGRSHGAQPLIMGALLILAMLILSQLFLPYGYSYALPDMDTGNSRFSIPFILSVIPAAIVTAHELIDENRRKKAV